MQASTGLAVEPPWRCGPGSASIKADFAPFGMIREQALLSPHRRPPGTAAAAPAAAGLEQAVVASLLAGEGAESGLVDTIAALAAQALQQMPDALAAEGSPSPAASAPPAPSFPPAPSPFLPSPDPQAPVVSPEVRSLAARIATGLAVALLQSDLGERITARLAAEAPFADGWLSCPE